MVYVALAEAAIIVAVVSVFAGLVRSLLRSHARREDALIDRLMHATGNTWTPPPASLEAAPDVVPRSWTASPEQEFGVAS